MNVAAYIRVSTSDQTAENQLPAILDYCKAHWWPEPEIYAENESAWRSGRQVELSKLLQDCMNGKKFDILVIWSLDRLSRQGIASILNLINTFKTYGCKVISIKEAWTDTEGPMQELLLAVFGWAAQYESKLKSERTLAGLARAKSEGKHLGRPTGSKDKQKRSRRGYLLRYAGPAAKKRGVNVHS